MPWLRGPVVTSRIVEPQHPDAVVFVYTLSGDFGSFALTGQNATLEVGLPVGAGAFTETGQNATPQVALPASAGSFTENGQEAIPQVVLPADAGAFAETGQNAILEVSILAGQGSFAETGQSATLDYVPSVVIVPAPIVPVIVTPVVVLPEAPRVLQPLPGVLPAQAFAEVQPQKVESHGVPSLSMEVPWYRRKKNILSASGAAFNVSLGEASFRIERNPKVIIPQQDYELLCSGGSFLSMAGKGWKSAGKTRQVRNGKFIFVGGKAYLRKSPKPPDDEEEEQIVPVTRRRSYTPVAVMERDDEEALVVMLERMEW